MMRANDYLSLQANIICVLLALIGSTAIIKHPGWFGGPYEPAARAEPSVGGNTGAAAPDFGNSDLGDVGVSVQLGASGDN